MLSKIGSVGKEHLLKYQIYLDEKVMLYLKNTKNYFENKIKAANSSLKAIS
jgi:transposase-like protein